MEASRGRAGPELDALCRRVVDTAGEGLYAVDGEGRCTFINTAGALMFRVDAVALIGEDIHARHHGAPASSCPACAPVPPEGLHRSDDQFVASDGTAFPVAYTVRGGSGDGVDRVVVFNEIRERKRVEAALRQAELKFRAVSESANDGIVSTDAAGRIVAWNGTAGRMFGYLEHEVLDTELAALLPGFFTAGSNFAEELLVISAATEPGGIGRTAAAEGRRKDGTIFPLEFSVAHWQGGDDSYLTAIMRDITRRRKSEAEVASGIALVKLLESVALAANEASDARAVMRFALEAICAHSGWSVGHGYLVETSATEALVAGQIWHLADPGFGDFCQATRTLALHEAFVASSRALEAARPEWIADVNAAGQPAHVRLAGAFGLGSAFALPVTSGSDVVAVLEFFSDTARAEQESYAEVMGQIGVQIGQVIERERTQERLRHQALHDDLTGLANRVLLLDRLRLALARAKRHAPVVVLFLDLDRFKGVNDSLGHDAGDQLLVTVAGRLQSVLRDGDTIGRFGGDEFVVVCEGVRSAAEAGEVAERLSGSLAAPIVLGESEVFVAVSIGIAISEGAEQSAQDLLRDADAALYRAKEVRRGGHALFDEQMRVGAVKRLATVNDLHRAIERDELVLHYQPVIDLVSGETIAMEALVRWNHPERGLVPPMEFIPVAEESGLIVALGRWVLHEACRQRCEWKRRIPGIRPLAMSVNLSMRELLEPSLVADIRGVLAASGCDAHDLVLEITESVFMADQGATVARVGQLKDLGVRIAIDDFGTGFSSFSALRVLPVDILKIDRSFIDGLGSDRNDSAITRAIIDMAKALKLETVAEGVECAGALEELRGFGCDFAQGYFFARPLSAPDMERFLDLQFRPEESMA